MSFFVYILYSQGFDRFYIGQTHNVQIRLERHNSGSEFSTKPYAPWDLVLWIEKETRSEAIILERKLKNLSRERLLLFIEKFKK